MNNLTTELEIKETEIIGDVAVNKEDVTPSFYFDYVKGLKQKINDEEIELIVDNCIKLIKKCKVTKQTAMAKELAHQCDLAIRELTVAKKGFDIFVSRKDIEKYIEDVEGKAIKIIELSNYTREIPDSVMDKLEAASELFDEMYIIFTDYSKKETKKIAKARRDKDPILFGAFKDNTVDDKNIYIEDKLFFIADWVDETCDLTLEEIAKDIKNKTKEDIVYKITTPTEETEIKNYLKSFNKPVEEVGDTVKKISFSQKIASVVKKTRRKNK